MKFWLPAFWELKKRKRAKMQHWVHVSAFNDPIFHGKLMALIISIAPQDKDSMPFSTEKMTFHYLASTGGEQSSLGIWALTLTQRVHFHSRVHSSLPYLHIPPTPISVVILGGHFLSLLKFFRKKIYVLCVFPSLA